MGVTDLRFVEADHSTLKHDVIQDSDADAARRGSCSWSVSLARSWRQVMTGTGTGYR